MKKFKVIAVIFAVLFVTMGAANAQESKKKQKVSEQSAKEFMKRTDGMIEKTAERVKEKKVHKGHLSMARTLEKESKLLFKEGKYNKATKKSYKARRHAFVAFQDNGGTVKENWKLNADEKKIISKDLRKKITKKKLRTQVKKKAKNKKAENGDLKKKGKKKKKEASNK